MGNINKMLSEKLGLVEALFRLITEEKDVTKEVDSRFDLELIDKDEELGKIDLERDLNSTGKKKKDFYRDVIDLINKTIEGYATVDEVVEFIKKRKKREINKKFY